MEIKLNGESKQIEEGLTIGQLLLGLGIENRNLAIEHNGDFLESEDLEKTAIKSGDKLEIVRFVGGG
jgi:sulfur carrier protein